MTAPVPAAPDRDEGAVEVPDDGYVPPEDDLMYPYNDWQDYMGCGAPDA